MSFEARLYGLRLHSNCPLPGLTEAADIQPADIRFELCEGPPAAVPEVAAINWHSQPLIETGCGAHLVHSGTNGEGRFWRLWFGSDAHCQSVEFVIEPAGRRIWAFRQAWGFQREPISIQDVTALLLGSVLGWVLRLRGTICLHASVIALGARAVVVLGDKGMGKSTVAASLAERGHAILADDLAAVTNCDGTHVVHAGYPRLRLRPATVRALKVSDAKLIPVLPTLDKRYLELADAAGDEAPWRFQSKSMPVGAIFLLTRDAGLDAPVIQPVAAAHRLATLLAQTSVRFMPIDEARRAQEFVQLSRLAVAVPFFRLQCPEGMEHLPTLCEEIENTALDFAFSAA